MKVTMISFVVDPFGTVPNELEKGLEQLEITERITGLVIIELLKVGKNT